MPYVWKTDAYAQTQEGIYTVTEMRLRNSYSTLQSYLNAASQNMSVVLEKLNCENDLEGDYYTSAYATKKNKYSINYKLIMGAFEDNLENLRVAIAQAESKKNYWAAKAGYYEWEEEKDGRD